jgi:hypothetical protein
VEFLGKEVKLHEETSNVGDIFSIELLVFIKKKENF